MTLDIQSGSEMMKKRREEKKKCGSSRARSKGVGFQQFVKEDKNWEKKCKLLFLEDSNFFFFFFFFCLTGMHNKHWKKQRLVWECNIVKIVVLFILYWKLN